MASYCVLFALCQNPKYIDIHISLTEVPILVAMLMWFLPPRPYLQEYADFYQ